jgi:hypothetical protein
LYIFALISLRDIVSINGMSFMLKNTQLVWRQTHFCDKNTQSVWRQTHFCDKNTQSVWRQTHFCDKNTQSVWRQTHLCDTVKTITSAYIRRSKHALSLVSKLVLPRERVVLIVTMVVGFMTTYAITAYH